MIPALITVLLVPPQTTILAISIEQGATWYQQGNVTISHDQYVTGLASAGCIGVRGGSWVQDGDIIITVQSNGVMVTGKTTHWLQRGAVSVLVPNTATAIAQSSFHLSLYDDYAH